MASINASTKEKVVSIRAFLGLHESPDGDNKIKLGEATVCRNFKITENGNLRKRAGTTELFTLGDAPVKGMWHGWVNKREVFMCACAGHIWKLMDDGVMETENPVDMGAYDTENDVCFFGFEEKLWLLNGKQYAMIEYADGSWSFTDVSSGSYGYRPLVAISIPPGGGGELLEQTNKLNGKRRVWISPDGEGNLFPMPEKNILNVQVFDTATNEQITTGWSFTSETGEVVFTQIPEVGVNSYEIQYDLSTSTGDIYKNINRIKSMRYAELYAGTQDNRVFLYGDGTNEAFYSGLDYWGKPRADYFPDLNVVAVGDANTPISAMIRHYGRLVAFKNPVGCYALDYGVVTLADTTLTPAFYSTPLNKILGNEADGQVQLVLNAPRTLSAGHLFEWRNGSAYSANISMDERQAKRISDRIYATLRNMDFSKVHCYDDNLHQEYYIVDDDGNALVHNYMIDAWYYYTGVDARMLMEVQGNLYIGTKSGKILLLDENAKSDSGTAIDCYWESGSMDFGGSYMRKYSALVWIGIKSENDNSVVVTSKTDRSIDNTEVTVAPEFDNDLPKIKRCKIKVKKFVYYKLAFSTNTNDTTTTVVDAELKVRYTSQAK
jgi:hypothetical protein